MAAKQQKAIILTQLNTMDDLDLMLARLVKMVEYCCQYEVTISKITCRTGKSLGAINRLKAFLEDSKVDYVLIFRKEDLALDKEDFAKLNAEFKRYGIKVVVYENAIAYEKGVK